jgi:DNA polymerase
MDRTEQLSLFETAPDAGDKAGTAAAGAEDGQAVSGVTQTPGLQWERREGTGAPDGGTDPPDPGGGVGSLEDLAGLARQCRRCGLRLGCRGVVFGEGDPRADILFLGEGPGAVEDELGRPFVGPAGQLLDKILLAVGFRREEVYITNTVLCRPPDNRPPFPDEVAACRVWLDRRLALIDPAIIVCLGASAAQSLLGRDLRITRDRGRWYMFGRAKVMPTFHPAALLRDPSKKRDVWQDMKAVRAEWETLRDRRLDPAR